MVMSLTEMTGGGGPLPPDVLERIERCIRDGLEHFATAWADKRHEMSKRTEASVINDIMLRLFSTEFGIARAKGGRDGVHTKGNTRLVLFRDGTVQIKVKKLDRQLRPRSIQTQQVLRFVWQQTRFEQVPAITNLFVGYQTQSDAALTSSKIWVMCPRGTHVEWKLELTRLQKAEPKGPAEVAKMPTQDVGKSKRTRLKETGEAKSKPKRAGKDGNGSGSS